MDTGKPTPLSDDEIAELRRLASEDPRCCGMIGGRWLLPALLDHVDRARALLRRIEVAGTGDDDATSPCCPSCRAVLVLTPYTKPIEHKPGCELAALIAGAPPAVTDADVDRLLDAAAARAENSLKLK